MKVTFQATVDDFVDITMRSQAVSSSEYYQTVGLSAAGAGAVIAVPIYLIAGTWPLAVIAFVAASAGIVIYNYGGRERRLRELFRSKLRMHEPRTVMVEIKSEGIGFEQYDAGQSETTFKTWDAVESIEETSDAIYFKNKGGLYSAVRKRGFASDEEMKDFLDLANQYRTAALAS